MEVSPLPLSQWQKRINMTGLNRLIRKTGAGSMDKK